MNFKNDDKNFNNSRKTLFSNMLFRGNITHFEKSTSNFDFQSV